MQRYQVTVVPPGTTGARPVLLIPFRPDALVTAFIDELFRRIARQKITITADTHIATLRLDSETGALIDAEDLLGDVVSAPKTEKLFSVFTQKDAGVSAVKGQSEVQQLPNHIKYEGASLPIRIITASTAKHQQGCPIIHMPLKSTIRNLHERVAEELKLAANFDEHVEQLECNLVSGKSHVERLEISAPTEAAVNAALCQRFGGGYELTKRLALVGANMDVSNASIYKKTPVAAICSKQRHTPVHARVDVDESRYLRSKVLDLHTAEIPISSSCMGATLDEARLTDLIHDGAVDIFAVSRSTTGQNTQAIGKSNIFRARSHWTPTVKQSDRGMAMYLSSLMVFASLVQKMEKDERSQDAVLHAFDLLTNFPPAIRTLHIIIQGNTPTAVESAAFSAAMFQALDSFAPKYIIGSDQSRVFELSRLFLGFLLEKARSLKLPEFGGALPYLTSLQSVGLTDHKTGEAVMRAVQTSQGIVEAAVFDSFSADGLLADTHFQSRMTRLDINSELERLALLSGGAATNIVAFSKTENYRYTDAGDVNAAIDQAQQRWEHSIELAHLAPSD